MTNQKATRTLGYVFAMVAVVFVIIGTLSGMAALFVHQRTPGQGDVIGQLVTRCLLSLGLAVIALACAKNWFRR